MKNLLSNPNYDFNKVLQERIDDENNIYLKLENKDLDKKNIITLSYRLSLNFLRRLKVKYCLNQIDNDFIFILNKILEAFSNARNLKCEIDFSSSFEKSFYEFENLCALYMFSKMHPDKNFTKKLLSVLPNNNSFFYQCCLLSEGFSTKSIKTIENVSYKDFVGFLKEDFNKNKFLADYIKKWPKLVFSGKVMGIYEKGHIDEKHIWGGYWSFSAAWAAYVFNLDDSAFVDNEFYPSALVQLARSTHPVDPSRKLNAHIAEVSTELPVFDIDKSLKINLLKRYKNLLDVIYKDLPSNAKDKVFASAEKLAVEALAEHESIDTIDYLNDVFCFLHQAEFDLEFLTQYKISYTILVDWKDSDTAVDLTSAASKSHGLNTEFEFDDSDCENYSVEDVLNQFDQWLVPHGKRLVQHDTESDFFVAFVIDNTDSDMVSKELDKLSAP